MADRKPKAKPAKKQPPVKALSPLEADLAQALEVKQPQTEIEKVAEALGIKSFDPQTHTWSVLIGLVFLIRNRMTLAENVCEGIAKNVAPEETMKRMQEWANLLTLKAKP